MAYFKARVTRSVKKKQRQDKGKKEPNATSYRKMILPFSIFLAVAVIFTGFYLLYFKSPYFTVSDLITSGRVPESTVDYSDLKGMVMGKNIFVLKLDRIREYMLENYPEISNLEFTRAFPASIAAQIVMRYPIAQIQQGSYYPVDEDCVLLSRVKDAPDEGLPIISGVHTNLSRRVGKKADSRRVEKALSLLKEISSSGILEEHKLVEIDLSNLRNAIFFLEDGLEVKIGREDYALRLNNLKAVLQDRKITPSDIRYIDLRFKEPVIGTKWKR